MKWLPELRADRAGDRDAQVMIRVQRVDGTWIDKRVAVPSDLMTRQADDPQVADALLKINRAFMLAYSEAFPRLPGRHRHRKPEAS